MMAYAQLIYQLMNEIIIPTPTGDIINQTAGEPPFAAPADSLGVKMAHPFTDRLRDYGVLADLAERLKKPVLGWFKNLSEKR